MVSQEPEYQLSHVSTALGTLQVPSLELENGSSVRLAIWAKDVGIALRAPTQSSLLNTIGCIVVSAKPYDSSRQLVTLRNKNGGQLSSLITRKSAEALQLRKGQACFAMIKSVSITA